MKESIAFLRSGLGIVIVVVVLVSGRLLWVNASRPAHRQEITAAFGSVSLFYGVPQMNRDDRVHFSGPVHDGSGATGGFVTVDDQFCGTGNPQSILGNIAAHC